LGRRPRYRAIVLLGAWSGLRFGELAGLTRERIDPLHGVLHLKEQPLERIICANF
jgi:hypothetical protein